MANILEKSKKTFVKVYHKPSIKSSRIKTISFYGRDSIRGAADSEYLLAEIPT